jgi:hypothetical protein
VQLVFKEHQDLRVQPALMVLVALLVRPAFKVHQDLPVLLELTVLAVHPVLQVFKELPEQ